MRRELSQETAKHSPDRGGWRPAWFSPRILLVAGFIAASSLLAKWVYGIGGPSEFVEKFGTWAPLVSVPANVVLAASPFPGELFAIANGAIYGLWIGTVLSWVGWTIGASLEYAIVRVGSAELDVPSLVSRLPERVSRFPTHHPAFLILGRFLPLGYHIVNVVAGATRVSPWRHFWCLAVANAPVSFVLTAGGAGVQLL